MIQVGAVIAELCALFSFWAWCRVDRSARWLLTGSAAATMFLILVASTPYEGGRSVLVFFGVYVCAGMIWVWLVERSPPRDWNMGERAVALFGVVLCASPALPPW